MKFYTSHINMLELGVRPRSIFEEVKFFISIETTINFTEGKVNWYYLPTAYVYRETFPQHWSIGLHFELKS